MSQRLLDSLLTTYDRVMVLKLFVDSGDNILKDMYYNAAHNHNTKLSNNEPHIDAGFDLFAPGNEREDLLLFEHGKINKLDLNVCCAARMFTCSGKKFNTGYYMYPRSSLSKTQLRLANSTGIIDAGYRGHLMGMFDVNSSTLDYIGKKYERYLQICAPGLVPIIVEMVGSKEELGEETARGSGGFGSTGS